MIQKNDFMLLFRYEPNNNYQPTEVEMNEMHQQWGAFIGNIVIQEKLISTHQLSFEGKQIFANKSVTEGIHIADKQTLGGNMIVKANTIDEAVEMAKNCPILLMGGTVEVRAIQPM
ncbi:YciI family protein [Arcicella sp. LKC2W]|uniref:YciI family protein n=1 Tax=Arcicella sp. LKC2W TaxID=2984198 RepID=UPI002B1E9BF0|nr:YciI family protein [Arcicella sp. LKC2W]MEA5461044.1 YciI family protein [Arcicella sp. LKC2W]